MSTQYDFYVKSFETKYDPNRCDLVHTLVAEMSGLSPKTFIFCYNSQHEYKEKFFLTDGWEVQEAVVVGDLLIFKAKESRIFRIPQNDFFREAIATWCKTLNNSLAQWRLGK